jgi:ribosome recycling factor
MIADIKKSAEQKMQKSVEALRHDLGKVRTGRAHTGLLDHIQVDYYGTPMPINQCANITLADARTIAVQPWEKKMVPAIEKAIRDVPGSTRQPPAGDPRAVSATESGAAMIGRAPRAETRASRCANVRRDGVTST